jgi:hypothetical protein
MFQQKMAGNCLFVHPRTGENNLPVSYWLKNKYFPIFPTYELLRASQVIDFSYYNKIPVSLHLEYRDSWLYLAGYNYIIVAPWGTTKVP